MKNKKLITMLLLVPLSGFSAIDDIKAERMKILSDLGLPLPDSGIKLVPRSTFGLTEEEMKIGLFEQEQMKNQGYIEDKSPRAMELIHFKQHAQLQLKQYVNVSNESSSHLRGSIKDIKLGFPFKSVPQDIMSASIGFVPQGGFHKEGWSGAVQFFEVKNFGTCAYAEMNVAISHTAIEIAIEDADYTINDKLSLIEVRGNKGSGFDYKIRWFDNIAFHELECATKKYYESNINKVIELAKTIDNRYT